MRIDAHSIIHPYAKIHAQAGEVRIGKGSIVAERVVLGGRGGGGGDGKGDANGGESGQRGGARGDARRNDNGTDDNDGDDDGNGNDDGDEDKPRTALGSNVVLESGAVVEEGCRIGDMSVVDVEGKVGAGSVVGQVSDDDASPCCYHFWILIVYLFFFWVHHETRRSCLIMFCTHQERHIHTHTHVSTRPTHF